MKAYEGFGKPVVYLPTNIGIHHHQLQPTRYTFYCFCILYIFTIKQTCWASKCFVKNIYSLFFWIIIVPQTNYTRNKLKLVQFLQNWTFNTQLKIIYMKFSYIMQAIVYFFFEYWEVEHLLNWYFGSFLSLHFLVFILPCSWTYILKIF